MPVPLSLFEFIYVPFLLLAVAVLFLALVLLRKKVDLVSASNKRFRSTFESIWRIEKAVLETTDFNEATKQVVNIILTELGYVNFGYEVIVLSLLDSEKKALRRIAISNTEAAGRFLSATPIPFNEIVIPLSASENLSVRSISERKMFVATNVSEVLAPALSKEWVDNFQEFLGIKTSIVYPIIAKDKVLGSLIFSLSKEKERISDEEWSILDSFVGAVGIALDNALLFKSLTDTTEKLKAANERLQELDKLKDEFVSLASHELRTPMTVIQGYAWMILNDKDDKLSDNNKQRLEKVLSSTQRLIVLVNDILDVSRIESGMMVFKPVVFDIALLAGDVAGELLDKSKKNNVVLKVNKSASYNVDADKDKIHEVLLNLMDNAIKYSPNGGEVNVNFKTADKAVEVSVSDTGMGIAKENLEKLFTKFGRLENTLSSGYKTPGTGLGLYLSKKIVEKSGGQIWAESELGKGSTFSFTVPKAQ